MQAHSGSRWASQLARRWLRRHLLVTVTVAVGAGAGIGVLSGPAAADESDPGYWDNPTGCPSTGVTDLARLLSPRISASNGESAVFSDVRFGPLLNEPSTGQGRYYTNPREPAAYSNIYEAYYRWKFARIVAKCWIDRHSVVRVTAESYEGYAVRFSQDTLPPETADDGSAPDGETTVALSGGSGDGEGSGTIYCHYTFEYNPDTGQIYWIHANYCWRDNG